MCASHKHTEAVTPAVVCVVSAGRRYLMSSCFVVFVVLWWMCCSAIWSQVKWPWRRMLYIVGWCHVVSYQSIISHRLVSRGSWIASGYECSRVWWSVVRCMLLGWVIWLVFSSLATDRSVYWQRQVVLCFVRPRIINHWQNYTLFSTPIESRSDERGCAGNTQKQKLKKILK